MLAERNPREAYRRIDVEARIAGADGRELMALCFEQLTDALGAALLASERGDNAMKSRALTRALSSVTALRMGVSGEGGVAEALRAFWENARRILLDSALDLNRDRLEMLRTDCRDIAAAMTAQA
jgi:flagellin-specific chaperone FliS